jgi:hypothetical protein
MTLQPMAGRASGEDAVVRRLPRCGPLRRRHVRPRAELRGAHLLRRQLRVVENLEVTRARSHRRSRHRGTESLSESGINWMSSSTTRGHLSHAKGTMFACIVC